MATNLSKKGWSVVFAGTGINLALGILYTWSIFKGAIKTSIETGGEFNWEMASINDPYAVCCLVFAFAMILAGKVQDKFGPRVTALIGGLMVATGFVAISQTSSYWGWVLGFGVLAGAGIGFAYSSATPPALKWFPPAKTGLIAGIVVSGFGLASVYIAPLASYLVANWGLQKSMMFFGIGFVVVLGVLSNLLVNPPAGYVPAADPGNNPVARKTAPAKPGVDCRPAEMLRSYRFYVLWLAYFIGAGAGLMVIGSVAGMAKKSLGEMAFLAVAIMAVGNAAGRIVAGVLSDKIGRVRTLVIMLFAQAVLMLGAIPVVGAEDSSAILLVLVATFIGFNYGTNLALFPSLTKDYWGLKNFGMNYGILFTSWGVGGFVLSRLSQMFQTRTGSFTLSLLFAGFMLIVGAMMTLTLEKSKADEALEEAFAEEEAETETSRA